MVATVNAAAVNMNTRLIVRRIYGRISRADDNGRQIGDSFANTNEDSPHVYFFSTSISRPSGDYHTITTSSSDRTTFEQQTVTPEPIPSTLPLPHHRITSTTPAAVHVIRPVSPPLIDE